jgi:GDP-4-dehydro-6-deoxy-D-mannose reductase
MSGVRVLVTGADCFIGSWLAEAITAAGDEVVGLSRKAGTDITNAEQVQKLVRDTKPARVFHLAAQSNIARSVADPLETFQTNVVGSTNLFEALRVHAPDATVVSIGSSSEYGDTARTIDFLDEDARLLPTSPYAISKVAQGSLTRFYARAWNMRALHVRPFAIIGPRKETDALSDFSKTIVQIELGRATDLAVGNTSALRDFVDVRDCASALMLLADKGVTGETYNVCNDRATSLDDVLALLQKAAKAPFTVRTDPARFRRVDDQRIVGSSAKIRALGFAPRHALEETIATTLEFWRARA